MPKTIQVDRVKKGITKNDLLFSQAGKKKTVNIADDDDFPDLDLEHDVIPTAPKKAPVKGAVTVNKNKNIVSANLGDTWGKAAEERLFGNQMVELASNKVRPNTSKPIVPKKQ